MSNNLKVKVILGNDIRRWRYNKSDNIQQLSSLKEFVSSSFNINDFWLQYEDDEGDRLTLSSNNDFEDAFTCAQEEDRKSLKIYIIQGSINSAQRMRASSIGSNIPNNAPPQSPQNGPCQPDPDIDVNKCFEMKAAAIDFLQNPEIVKLLPDLHRRLFEEIRKKKQEVEEQKEPDTSLPKWDSPAMIETIFRSILTEDKFQPIINHDLYAKKLDSMIPHLARKISGHLPILMNFSCEAIAAWIPHLANVLGHGFNTFGSFGGDDGCGDMPSAMSTFFPLMCSFMAQHGDYSGLSGFCDSQDRDSQTGEVIHRGVQCDSCGSRPIKGSRFKCLKCSNYDLCGQCESFGKHDPTHPMIKFNHSARSCGPPPFDGFHEIMKHFGNPHHGGHGPHGHWFGNGHRRNRWNKWNRFNNNAHANNGNNGGFQPHPHGPPHHPHAGMGHPHHPWGWNDNGANWGHGGHRAWKKWNKFQQNQSGWNNHNNDMNWRQFGMDQSQNNNDSQSVISSTISSNTMDNGNNGNKKNNENEKKIKVMADFVKDVTLPDRTYYPTDTVLTKQWKMKNNGEHEWGNNVELVFFKGNESLTLEKRYPVINAKPGEEVDVSAVIKTPDKPGRYCSYYRLQRNGEYFGPRVWVDIFAVDEENTQELNKNIEPKWKKNKNKNKKGKNKNKNNDKMEKQKEKQQDMKIKLEKKEAKLEAKQEKLAAKARKLEEERIAVTKELNKQSENVNSSKLVKKQAKNARQLDKVKHHMDKLKNKQNQNQKRMQDARNVVHNEISQNSNNNGVMDDKALDALAEQVVAGLELEQKQDINVNNLAQNIHGALQLPAQPIQHQQVQHQQQNRYQAPPSKTISCVCGMGMLQITPNAAYGVRTQVSCDICGKHCPSKTTIYHCPIQKSAHHPEGYDLCQACAELQLTGFIPQQQPQQPRQSQQRQVQPQVQAQPQPQPQPIQHQRMYPNLSQVPQVANNGFVPQLYNNHQQLQQQQHQIQQQSQMVNMNHMLNNMNNHQMHQQQIPPIMAHPQPPMNGFVYQQQLDLVKSMGFTDNERIKVLLLQQKGNVQRVLNLLMNSQNGQ